MKTLRGKDFFISPKTPIYSGIFRHHGENFAHDHDFLEIVVIFGGKGRHHSIHGVKKVISGDVIILRPGTWHYYDECKHLDILNICFGAELFQRELHWVLEEPAISHLFWNGVLSLKQNGVLMFHIPPKIVQYCVKQVESHDLVSPFHLAARQAMNMGTLLTILSVLSQYAPRNEKDALERKAHHSVLRGIRFLEMEYAKDWSLEKLSEKLSINKFYLVRLFKSVTGLSPMAYLSRIRSERAATLLLHSEWNVSEVGIQVGWDDPNYFARCFRKHFGLTASDYRKRFQNPNMTSGS